MSLSTDRYFRQFGVEGRAQDDDYLAFVRALPCLVCDRSPCDPDHLQRQSQGRNDYLCIPLCREHHTERHKVGVSKFEEKHRIDLEHALIAVMGTFLIGRAG